MRYTSIRTRIKTAKETSIADTEMIKETLPLEQGLRL